MMGRPRLSLPLASAALLALVSAAPAQEALRVCLNENIPLYSVRNSKRGSGFDVMIAEAVAKRLGRPLAIQWFETKLEADASLTIEANTLLSDGRCDLVGGYPLIKGGLGKPRVAAGKMAAFAGAKASDRRRRVALGELVPTRPYHRAPLALVVNTGVTKPINGLVDLEGLRIAVEASTLADAILMGFKDGRLVNHITHLVPGRENPLPRVEAGEFEVTLINLRRFDAFRAQNPTARLKATGFYHRVGPNMGFVGLATNGELIESVNRVIAEMAESGELKALGEASGLTYVAPREPFVGDNVTIADLSEK
jgi:ABC-type amino acid transport substrate-binding protein